MRKYKSILQQVQYRQYPLPDEPWLHYQEWYNNIMLHWKIDKDTINQYIPQGIELDLFEGDAYVSIIAFSVKKLRPRFLPPFPYLSNFHEVNLRTYVIRDGKPGIYFLSIEAEKLLPALFARFFIGLPYKKSLLKRESNYYFAQSNAGTQLELSYSSGELIIEKSELDLWLTERYCLYEQTKGKLFRIDIHHKPWILSDPLINIQKLQYPFCQGNPVYVHYSHKIEVLFWKRIFLD